MKRHKHGQAFSGEASEFISKQPTVAYSGEQFQFQDTHSGNVGTDDGKSVQSQRTSSSRVLTFPVFMPPVLDKKSQHRMRPRQMKTPTPLLGSYIKIPNTPTQAPLISPSIFYPELSKTQPSETTPLRRNRSEDGQTHSDSSLAHELSFTDVKQYDIEIASIDPPGGAVVVDDPEGIWRSVITFQPAVKCCYSYSSQADKAVQQVACSYVLSIPRPYSYCCVTFL